MEFNLFDEYGNKVFVIETDKDRYKLTGVNEWKGRRWNFDLNELYTFMQNNQFTKAYQTDIYEMLGV